MKESSTRVVITQADLLKPRTAEQKAELKALAEMPDEEIDFSDIPELPEGYWKGAKLFSEVFKPRKQLVSMRIDADLLAWLKKTGPGYQSRVNEVLRRHMLSELSRTR